MNYTSPENWSLEIETDENEHNSLEYKYIFKNEQSGKVEEEWGAARNVSLKRAVDKLTLIDAWNSISDPNNNYLTAPFVDVLLKPNFTPEKGTNETHYSHIFKVKAPMLAKNEVICIVGNCAELGNWDVTSPRILSNKNFPEWNININLSKAGEEIHYKYGI